MGKKSTYSRRQRRMELRRANFLKIKNMYSRFSPQAIAWYNKMQEDGKAAHEAQERLVNDQIEEQLELRLKGNFDEETGKGFYGLRNTWADQGYNKEEIELLEEAWIATTIKDADHAERRADKKKANQLRKQAQELRAARA
jgi:hypothetical protein